MKITKLFLIFAALLFTVSGTLLAGDDLNVKKMEMITGEICDIMIKGDDSGDRLKKFISEDWLDTKNIKLKKYKINNYSPEKYQIVYTGGDVCIVTIGGNSWSHLLVFKFSEEYGKYYVVPRGISEASSDYIDPWWSVKDYICSPENDMPEDK